MIRPGPSLHRLVLIAVACLPSLAAQTPIAVTAGPGRAAPRVGYMLNYLTKPDWSDARFVEALRALGPELLRYPGGTESQYFDWRTGRSLPASAWTSGTLASHGYIGTVPHVAYPLSELLRIHRMTGVVPVFCLNLLTRDLEDQLLLLRTARDLGLPVRYVELGNELYFADADFVRRFPSSAAYLDEITAWIPALRREFPGVQIAVIGSFDGPTDLNGNAVPARIAEWNAALRARNFPGVANTFHYYIPPNTTTLARPVVAQALAAPFRHWPTLRAGTLAGFPSTSAWITEYNLNDGNQTTYAIASSWTHGLFTASLFSLMLAEPSVGMLLCHQVAGSASFASVDSYTNFGSLETSQLTAVGHAMRLIHAVARERVRAEPLVFSSNPEVRSGPTAYPSLLGWRFSGNGPRGVYVLNLSASAFDVDLGPVLGSEGRFEEVRADDPLKLRATQDSLRISTASGGTRRILPAYTLLAAFAPATPPEESLTVIDCLRVTDAGDGSREIVLGRLDSDLGFIPVQTGRRRYDEGTAESREEIVRAEGRLLVPEFARDRGRADPARYERFRWGDEAYLMGGVRFHEVGLSATAEPPPFTNLSARGEIGPDTPVVIGTVVSRAPVRVLIRAIGPSLGSLGVSNPAVDPRLLVFDGNGVKAGANDDWGSSDDAAGVAAAGSLVGAFPLALDSRDAALLATLAPGSWTFVANTTGAAGAVLVELYQTGGEGRLVNLSARALLRPTDSGAVIVGAVVAGAETDRKRLPAYVRAVGPELTVFGIRNAHADPRLERYRGATLLDVNDDRPLSLRPVERRVTGWVIESNSTSSAGLELLLAPGATTLVAKSQDRAAEGTVLVELYRE